MKNIIILMTVLAAPFFVNGQNNHSPHIDKEIFNICASIAVVGLFMAFILAFAKKIIDYRIKKSVMENGVPETVVSSLLQQTPMADRNNSLKWALIFTGLGIAFTVIYYYLPIGIHSLAILAFCMAGSFFAYTFVLHRQKNN